MHYIDIGFIRKIPKRFVDCLPFQAHRAILEGTENILRPSALAVSLLDEILPMNSEKTLSIVRRQVNDIVGMSRYAFIVRMPEVLAILSDSL